MGEKIGLTCDNKNIVFPQDPGHFCFLETLAADRNTVYIVFFMSDISFVIHKKMYYDLTIYLNKLVWSQGMDA